MPALAADPARAAQRHRTLHDDRGVFGRLLDAGLRASLLVRGKVPAGLAAPAAKTYREQLDAGRFTWHGAMNLAGRCEDTSPTVTRTRRSW